MRKHPFDPVALVFGLTFAGAGIVVLAGGELFDEGQFLLPACLVGLGIALLVQNALRNRAADRAGRTDMPVVTPSFPAASGADDLFDDGDDLFTDDGTTLRSTAGVEWTGPPAGATTSDTDTDTEADARPDDRAGD